MHHFFIIWFQSWNKVPGHKPRLGIGRNQNISYKKICKYLEVGVRVYYSILFSDSTTYFIVVFTFLYPTNRINTNIINA